MDLLMQIKRITFNDAAKEIAKLANIDLPTYSIPKPKDEENFFFNFAAMHYNMSLLANKKVMDYLKNRNITEQDVEQFGIGYDDGSLYQAAHKINLNTALITKLNLNFTNRITFTIRNNENGIIAFGARSLLDLQPKYINSPNSSFFIKNVNHFIPLDFLHYAQKKDHIIITEGYLDAVQAWKNGYNNAISINGTSLSPQAIDNLADIVNNITLALDNDTPGQEATLKILPQLLQKNLTVSFADLKENEDLDKSLRNDPNIRLIQLSDYFINKLNKDLKISKSQLVKSTKQVISIIKKIPSLTYQIDTKRTIAQTLQLPITIL